jgi:phosphoribosylamine-glycine ligase
VVVDVPTDIPEDVLCYTGWVDVLERKPGSRRMRLRNSPTLMFQHTAPTLNEARARLYGVMKRIVPAPLEYRTDIGLIL